MYSHKKLIEWRSEEIAKILLRKCSYNIKIEPYPSSLFDLFVTIFDNPKHRFAVEVKINHLFTKNINYQLGQLVTFRNNGMIDIPVLLLKIDEEKETGELDFLVVPSISNKLLIRKKFNFKPVTKASLDNLIEKTIVWWDRH